MNPSDLPEYQRQPRSTRSFASIKKWYAEIKEDTATGVETLEESSQRRRSGSQRSVGGLDRSDQTPRKVFSATPSVVAVVQASAADRFLGSAATTGGEHTEELPPFIIHPLNRGYRAWWNLTVLVAAITAILEPYVIAFTPPGLYPYNSGTSIVEFLCIALIAIDILVSFNVGRYVNGELIVDRRQLARNYLRLFFFVDLVSIIPFDEIALSIAGLNGPNSLNDPQLAQYLSLLKLIRMLRCYRLFWFFTYLTYNLAAPLLMVTLVRNLFFIFFLSNFAACAFYYEALQAGLGPNTWVGANAEWFEGSNTAQMYIYSLYWSIVTLSTTGFGDIRAYNPVEAGLIAFWVLFLIFFSAYIIGSITLLVVKTDERVGEYRQRMQALQSYSTLHTLPRDLRESMQRHLKLHFYNAAAADEEVLKAYPSSIRRKVLRQLYLPCIQGCYLFNGVKPRFIDALLAVARVELYLPQVEIISQGDYVNELCIITRGTVACFYSPGDGGSMGGGRDMDRAESGADVSVHAAAAAAGIKLRKNSTRSSFVQHRTTTTTTTTSTSTDPSQASEHNINSNLPSTIHKRGIGSGSSRGVDTMNGNKESSLEEGRYHEEDEDALAADFPIKTLEDGDVFGELAFFTGTAQSDTVLTLTPCRVLAIGRIAFDQVAATFPTSLRLVLMHLVRHGEEEALELFPGRDGLQLFHIAMKGGGDVTNNTKQQKSGGSSEPSKKKQQNEINADIDGDPTWRLAPGRGVKLGLTPRQEQAVGTLLQVKAVVSRAVAKHDADRTNLWLNAATRGDSTKIREMLGYGWNPNAADYDGRTALMLASSRGFRDIVEAVLAAGANPNVVDAFGGTALLEACKHGHDDVIDVLIGVDAKFAASEFHEASLLCTAVHEGDLKLLRRLLRAGADANAGDYGGRTALHVAASEGNVLAVEMLITDGGADVGVRDRWGVTAVEEAQRVGARRVELFIRGALDELREEEKVDKGKEEIEEEEIEEEEIEEASGVVDGRGGT